MLICAFCLKVHHLDPSTRNSCDLQVLVGCFREYVTNNCPHSTIQLAIFRGVISKQSQVRGELPSSIPFPFPVGFPTAGPVGEILQAAPAVPKLPVLGLQALRRCSIPIRPIPSICSTLEQRSYFLLVGGFKYFLFP